MEAEIMEVGKFFEELQDKTLKIPYYQRGYRWRSQEVMALLSDIQNEDDGYCLQPIVLKENGKEIIIVDGQQRLTTITLIRKFFECNDKFANDLLVYDRSIIDNHFIKENWDTIGTYFNSESQNKAAFLCKLCKCRFIVCRLDNDENEEEVFMRLNAGKIPLSSAEILKAYYLTDDDQKKNCNDFYSRWLDIERKLQDNDFYYFFSHDENKSERYYSSRMDFLLEIYLIYEKLIELKDSEWEKEITKKYEASRIFAFTAIQKNTSAGCLITGLEKIIETMKFIYSDTELYNLYGFLSCSSFDNNLLFLLSSVISDENKLDCLKMKAKEAIDINLFNSPSEKQLGDLDFNIQKDKSKIKRILLLHNAIRSSSGEFYIRFDYNIYRNSGYDLEHIHARAELKSKEDLDNFYNEVQNEYKDKSELKDFLNEFKKFCDDYNATDIDKQNKLELWEDCIWVLDCNGSVKRVQKEQNLNGFDWQYVLKGEEEDLIGSWRFTSIRNLCLLSSTMNRSIGNSSFANKRKRVTEKYLKGLQLPVVSAEIFSGSKHNRYTMNENAAVWSRKYGDRYLQDIYTTIKEYLNV